MCMLILLVEDERWLAENAVPALREGPGFAVDPAGDGFTGVNLAGNGCYELREKLDGTKNVPSIATSRGLGYRLILNKEPAR